MTMIVSPKTRWFAVATGCLLAVAGGVGLGWGFALFVTSFLVVGALMQPRSPRTGRGLMCAGALWLSFWVFDIGVLRLTERSSTVGLPDLIIFACVALVALCDVLIAIEEVKIRRSTYTSNPLTRNASSNA